MSSLVSLPEKLLSEPTTPSLPPRKLTVSFSVPNLYNCFYMTATDINSEIENIKNQLVAKYRPEKIILFGSMALGNFGEDSDLDFLIVKDDPRRPLETEQELHRIIDYKIASDFIIVTPNEFQERIQNGDFFMEEILKTGKIIYG